MQQQQRSQRLDRDERSFVRGHHCHYNRRVLIQWLPKYGERSLNHLHLRRSTSQKLPACLHKNNKQDSHIYQYRKYSQLFLSLFDNPLRKWFEKKARAIDCCCFIAIRLRIHSIIGKDALNFKTNRTSFLFISFSRLIYRYKYRDIEREQWKAQQKQIQAKWFNFPCRKTIVYCLHGKTNIKRE